MRAVEMACQSFASPHGPTRAAAEATLLEFRNAPAPLPACRFILERSTMPDAAFQAGFINREIVTKFF